LHVNFTLKYKVIKSCIGLEKEDIFSFFLSAGKTILPTPLQTQDHICYDFLNILPPSEAVWKQKKKLEDLFSAVLSQLKKYHSPGNLKFNYLGIFQGLKLRISIEKNPFNFS